MADSDCRMTFIEDGGNPREIEAIEEFFGID